MMRHRSNLGILFCFLMVCQLDTNLYSADSSTLQCNKENQFTSESIVGTHIIAEFSDCTVPEDKSELEAILRTAAKDSGSTDLEFVAHKFEPAGITAVLILAESHISIHSWPENKYAAVDAFTCGKSNPRKAIEYLERAFNAGSVKITEVKRGQD